MQSAIYQMMVQPDQCDRDGVRKGYTNTNPRDHSKRVNGVAHRTGRAISAFCSRLTKASLDEALTRHGSMRLDEFFKRGVGQQRSLMEIPCGLSLGLDVAPDERHLRSREASRARDLFRRHCVVQAVKA